MGDILSQDEIDQLLSVAEGGDSSSYKHRQPIQSNMQRREERRNELKSQYSSVSPGILSPLTPEMIEKRLDEEFPEPVIDEDDALTREMLKAMGEDTGNKLPDKVRKFEINPIDRINNYDFQHGQLVFIKWDDNPKLRDYGLSHVFKDDALFGFVVAYGRDVKHLDHENKRWLTEGDYKINKSRNALKMIAMYSPSAAREVSGFDQSIGKHRLNYSRENRLLIEGVNLNFSDCGYGIVPIISRIKPVYRGQTSGQLLVDTGYLKEVNASAYLGDHIKFGLHMHNRDFYAEQMFDVGLVELLEKRRSEIDFAGIEKMIE